MSVGAGRSPLTGHHRGDVTHPRRAGAHQAARVSDLNFERAISTARSRSKAICSGCSKHRRAHRGARGKGTLKRLAAAALRMTRSNTLAGSCKTSTIITTSVTIFTGCGSTGNGLHPRALCSTDAPGGRAAGQARSRMSQVAPACRRARGRRGLRLGPALRAATHYGAKVRALSLSREQIATRVSGRAPGRRHSAGLRRQRDLSSPPNNRSTPSHRTAVRTR